MQLLFTERKRSTEMVLIASRSQRDQDIREDNTQECLKAWAETNDPIRAHTIRKRSPQQESQPQNLMGKQRVVSYEEGIVSLELSTTWVHSHHTHKRHFIDDKMTT